MSNSFEEKHHSFSQYLRDRQSQYYPMEMLEDIPDENILESYRRDFMDGSYHYTKEQEKSIIMECDSNESMLRAFEKLQHLKHSEELEGKLGKHAGHEELRVDKAIPYCAIHKDAMIGRRRSIRHDPFVPRPSRPREAIDFRGQLRARIVEPKSHGFIVCIAHKIIIPCESEAGG